MLIVVVKFSSLCNELENFNNYGMSAFQVPQFIDVEDKVVGPLTLRQFLFVALAAVIIFLSKSIFAFWLWIMLSIVVGCLGIALAFVKVNGQPLSKVVLNGIKYLIRPRLYVWQRGEIKRKVYETDRQKEEKKQEETKRLSPEELEKWGKGNMK